MSALARKLRPALVLGAALVSLAFSAGAAELRDVEVDLDDGRYHLTSQTWFDVEKRVSPSTGIDAVIFADNLVRN